MTKFNLAMLKIAANPKAIFVGQNVAYDGAAMYADLDGVPDEQRVEFPVAENLQLGYCAGLAIQGFLPVCIYPRMDFMLLALDQLVNHLDKLDVMSSGQFAPKVIIRTRVGSRTPLDAGPQHTQNHTEAFRLMLTTIDVWEIKQESDILPTYELVTLSPRSSIVVEAL